MGGRHEALVARVAQPVARELREKPAWLLELREIAVFRSMCAHTRVRGHGLHVSQKLETSRNSRNSRNHAPSRAGVAQPVAQLAQPHHTTHPRNEVMAEKKDMRELMPATAEMVDWLRQLLGREKADSRIKAAMQGKGGFWVQETGPDGVVREFGSRKAEKERT
jgi:hypothetical protein